MTRPGMWRDESHDFNDLAGRVKRVEMATLTNHLVSIEATLPNSPSDGQDYYYSLPDGGQWHFRFNERTGLWDFSGGPPLKDEVTTGQTTTSSSYVSLSGPYVTVPFNGEYDIWGHAGIFIQGSAGALAAVKLGASTISDDDRIAQANSSGATNGGQSGNRITRTLTAGDVLEMQYKSSGGVTTTFEFRRLTVTPVYVVA